MPDPFNEAHVSLFLATSRGRHHLFSENNATLSLPRCSGAHNIARIDPRRRSIFFRSNPVAALLSKVQEASTQKKRAWCPALWRCAVGHYELRHNTERVHRASRRSSILSLPSLSRG